MESYLRVVGQAVLVFPVAAALIALPFLIHHYRKYGGMTFARFFLSYSFVLYALCANAASFALGLWLADLLPGIF